MLNGEMRLYHLYVDLAREMEESRRQGLARHLADPMKTVVGGETTPVSAVEQQSSGKVQ